MVKEWPWPKEAAVGYVRSLTRAWRELEELDGAIFRIKPKFHLLYHLVAQVAPTHGPPALFWCYQDEDWGGRLPMSRHAGAAARRLPPWPAAPCAGCSHCCDLTGLLSSRKQSLHH